MGFVLKGTRRHQGSAYESQQCEADDKIYIYMCGHGAEGKFEFPEASLLPDDFIQAINNMHADKKFAKMVIFMTSSYSATMFKGLTENVNAYALTACDEFSKSTSTDHDESMKVHLSDKFSSAWLKFIDKADFKTATFERLVAHKQANFLEKNNPDACPCQFGNKEISHSHLSEFLEN